MSQPDMTLDRGFDAPWQAQAFAMVEALKASGRLSGADWAERLGAELAAGQINPEDYWTCYLHAFEAMLAETGFAPPQQVEDLTQAWHRAARATPHGKPITLDADPGA